MPASALAAGVMIAPSDLTATDRAALLTEIAGAKKTDLHTFDSVAALRRDIVDLDANKRGRLATVTPALKALGARGVPAMLSELAVSGGRGSLTDTAWLAWRLNLIEAIGAIRDKRATAVLEAILESPETDFMLVRAASQALGKLGTDRAAKKLVALSRKTDAKQLAVLAGMGHCRRQVVVERLSEAMTSAAIYGASRVEAKHIARALGDVGNAWAWQTPTVKASGEEASVRATAAESLIDAFVAIQDPEVRRTVTQAVLVVDDGSTKSLIAAARRGAGPDLRAALDDLERQFDNSPLH
jgi:hypothetical protein